MKSPVAAVVLRPPVNRPTPIRSLADDQANRVSRFVAKHPEYARLSLDVLLQYAETYRDDADHTLEQEYRDNGVLAGCRIDFGRFRAMDRGEVPFADNVALEAS